MKTAKSYKILFLCVTLVLSMILAISFLNFGSPVKAATTTVTENSATAQFSGVSDIKYTDGKMVAKVTNGDTVSVKNKLVTDDLAFEVEIPADVTKVTVTLKSDAYYSNGNKKVDAEDATKYTMEKSVVNELFIDLTDSANIKFNLNSESAQTVSAVNKITFNVVDGVLSATIGDKTSTNADPYFKVAQIEKSVASITFGFEVKEGKTADFAIKSIDQKASDTEGKYKQSFVMTDKQNGNNTEKVIEMARPMVTVEGDFKEFGINSVKVYSGKTYNLSFNVYSVFGNVKNSSLFVKDNDKISLYGVAENKKIVEFGTVGTTEFEVAYKDNGNDVVVEKYTASVIKQQDDTVAPKYNLDDNAIQNFKDALNKAIKTEIDGKEYSVVLGQKITIPSMKDLITDGETNYSSLKHTVYYNTPDSENQTTTGWNITVNKAGVYKFYVVFADAEGNTMEKDQFYTIDENDGSFNGQEYEKYLFEFVINADAPLSVSALAQGKAYVGTKYNAPSFDMATTAYKKTYTLYYNSNVKADQTVDVENDNNWVAVPVAANTSASTELKGITYDRVKAIGYDGALAFTPDQKGTYAIVCEITSESTATSLSATAFIIADAETVEVKPYDNWAGENVWSIVFLSIGTLCLIAIIALLFVKPKPKTEKVDDADEQIKKNK